MPPAACTVIVALGPQQRVEHQAHRFREAGARPVERGLDALPGGPGRRGRGRAPPACEPQHGDQAHERGGERERRQAAGAGRLQADSLRDGGRAREDRCEAGDQRAGHHAEHDAPGGQHHEPGAQRPRHLRGIGAGGPPGRPEQHQPGDLDEAVDRERGRQPEGAERHRARDPGAHAAGLDDVEERLQREPFGDEAVERDDARDRGGRDQERSARPRHPPQQAAEAIQAEVVRRRARRRPRRGTGAT